MGVLVILVDVDTAMAAREPSFSTSALPGGKASTPLKRPSRPPQTALNTQHLSSKPSPENCPRAESKGGKSGIGRFLEQGLLTYRYSECINQEN